MCNGDMVLTRIKICVRGHVKLRYINCSAQDTHLVVNLRDP